MCDILIAEDNHGVAVALCQWLAAAYRTSMGPEVSKTNPLKFSKVESLAELDAHKHEKHDCIILDLKFKDSSIENTLDWLKENARDIPPVIILTVMPPTGHKDTYEMAAFSSGALGFINKEEAFTAEGIMRLLRRIYAVPAVQNYWRKEQTCLR
jgi:DNA-binding response OmpR family regulator